MLTKEEREEIKKYLIEGKNDKEKVDSYIKWLEETNPKYNIGQSVLYDGQEAKVESIDTSLDLELYYNLELVNKKKNKQRNEKVIGIKEEEIERI